MGYVPPDCIILLSDLITHIAITVPQYYIKLEYHTHKRIGTIKTGSFTVTFHDQVLMLLPPEGNQLLHSSLQIQLDTNNNGGSVIAELIEPVDLSQIDLSQMRNGTLKVPLVLQANRKGPMGVVHFMIKKYPTAGVFVKSGTFRELNSNSTSNILSELCIL